GERGDWLVQRFAGRRRDPNGAGERGNAPDGGGGHDRCSEPLLPYFGCQWVERTFAAPMCGRLDRRWFDGGAIWHAAWGVAGISGGGRDGPGRMTFGGEAYTFTYRG